MENMDEENKKMLTEISRDFGEELVRQYMAAFGQDELCNFWKRYIGEFRQKAHCAMYLHGRSGDDRWLDKYIDYDAILADEEIVFCGDCAFFSNNTNEIGKTIAIRYREQKFFALCCANH